MSILDRFEQKVERIPESGCWVWTSATCSKGYGLFWFDGKPRKAHRVAYELHVGQIPEKMVIDHMCRERSCVNPAHLRAVTSWENTHAANSVAPAKKNSDKSACPRCGGEYSLNKRGGRICRPCLAKYYKARKASKKTKELASA